MEEVRGRGRPQTIGWMYTGRLEKEGPQWIRSIKKRVKKVDKNMRPCKDIGEAREEAKELAKTL